MTTYELVNPHDDYTFEAPDDAIADTVTALLGGAYGWARPARLDPDGEPVTGGLADFLDDGARERAVETAKEVLSHRADELAAALDTVAIKEAQRARLGVDPDLWHDEMRSSMSDLRATAREYARALRERADQ